MYAGNYPLATTLGGAEFVAVQGGLVQVPISLFDQRYAALAAQAAQNLNGFSVLGTQNAVSALAPLALFDSRYIVGSLAGYPSASGVGGLVLAGSQGGQIVQTPISLFDGRYLPITNANSTTAVAFGAKGDNVTDDTAAIQAALNTGLNVDFLGLLYQANNLVMPNVISPANANQQCLYSSRGPATITKNASGDLITSVVRDCQFVNMNFRGEASTPLLTGNNVVSRGNNFTMINCGSRWAFGRAVLATGSQTTILGQTDIYETGDQSASGFEIELGIAGTATLYHQIWGLRSTAAWGGIKLTDTGSTNIHGSQFGKLSILSGTSPAGVNGGTYTSNRILGTTTINVSNATFACCQFGAIAITMGVGTSGIRLTDSNTFENGCTIINSGNANNRIEKEISLGSVNRLRIGDDNSLAVLGSNPTNGMIWSEAGLSVGLSGGPQVLQGTGSPLNVVSAPQGSLFMRTDGGANTTLYVKEAGSGSTGWVAK